MGCVVEQILGAQGQEAGLVDVLLFAGVEERLLVGAHLHHDPV